MSRYSREALLAWVPTPEQRLAWLLGQLYGQQLPRTPFGSLGDLRLPDLLDWQKEFLEEVLDPTGPDRVAVYGGIGCGKSALLAEALFIVAMTRPESISLISSDNRENMTAISIRDCRKAFGSAAEYVGPPHSEFRFKNDSIVQTRAYRLPGTYDESKNPFEGRTVNGLLIVDEVQKLPVKVFDHADDRTRGVSRDGLANYYPKVILNGRPGAIDWWPKKVGRLGGAVFRPKTSDNPHNGPRYYAKLREGKTLREFLCLTEGAPMPLKGACYDIFEAEAWPLGNLLDDFEFDPTLPVTAGLDFGRRFPAVVFLQSVKRTIPHGVRVVLEVPGRSALEVDLPGGMVVTLDVVFDELMPDGVLTPDLIRHINARGYDLASVATDPAGGVENDQTGQANIKLLKRAKTGSFKDGLGGGLGCRVLWTHDAEKTSVTGGILRVQGAMCDANGIRLLVVARDLWERGKTAPPEQRTIYADLQKYTWDHVLRKGRGRVSAGDDPSHGPDALRYWFINYRWDRHARIEVARQELSAAERERGRWIGRER